MYSVLRFRGIQPIKMSVKEPKPETEDTKPFTEVTNPVEDVNIPMTSEQDEISAMLSKIDDRVATLKKSGEWGDDGQEYGQDPLKNVSLLSAIVLQIKAVKPYSSIGEFGQALSFTVLVTLFLGGYITIINKYMNDFIIWFNGRDFDFLGFLIRSS